MPTKSKTCLNPSCGKTFQPGHYGDRQLVCRGSFVEKCGKKCPGATCKRCKGKGEYKKSCRDWYKGHQLAVAQPPRGCGSAWEKIAASLKRLPLERAALIRVARASGLRKGELLGLTWGDVLKDGKARSQVDVRGKWKDGKGFEPTKTGVSRPAFFTEDARAAIDGLNRSLVRGGPARIGERIWGLSCAGAWSFWTAFQRGLGIANPDTGRPFRFHDLRHTVGVELVGAGKIGLAQQFLGHRSVNSTMKYAVRTAEDVLKEVEGVRRRKKK